MKVLNVRQESIKILEEKTETSLTSAGHSNFLLDTSLKAGETKAEVKIKSFCTEKETVNKTKRQSIEWEKTFTTDIQIKG